jgi:hypothetical protein
VSALRHGCFLYYVVCLIRMAEPIVPVAQ